MAINRRTAITSLIGATALAGQSLSRAHATIDRAAAIAAVEDYLNNITTLETRFAQIAPNGRLASGLLQLSRPGRLKMDYDPPSKILLIAPGDWRLIFYDGSIQQVNTIPIGQTPLGVLLDENIRLEADIEVREVKEHAGELALTLLREGRADQGSVTLIFAQSPLSLRRWTIIDAQGLATTVILERPSFGVAFNDDLFRWRDPKVFGFPSD